MPEWSSPSRRPLPLILIRGFGGLGIEDEKRIAYQGFNDGTVYPNKRGDNYIYEGMILKFMKSAWQYQDATNVVGYFPTPVVDAAARPADLSDLPDDFFFQPAGLGRVGSAALQGRHRPGDGAHRPRQAKTRDPHRTLWVFRYYDLNDRSFRALRRRAGAADRLHPGTGRPSAPARRARSPKVNIIAHSMGGLIVREAIQGSYPEAKRRADDYINKVVTLGTPHQGISFQVLSHWIGIDAKEELDALLAGFSIRAAGPIRSRTGISHEHFDLQRFLTVVGTNYRTYGVKASAWANRLFSVADEFGPNYNRSDGLVKQQSAQIPGAPRTFVHKCHGGVDSLVTSREAFEIVDPVLLRRPARPDSHDRRQGDARARTFSARASSSSASRSSRGGSTSICFIRASRPRTATARSAPPTNGDVNFSEPLGQAGVRMGRRRGSSGKGISTPAR